MDNRKVPQIGREGRGIDGDELLIFRVWYNGDGDADGWFCVLASARLGTAWLGSAPFGSAPFGSRRFA